MSNHEFLGIEDEYAQGYGAYAHRSMLPDYPPTTLEDPDGWEEDPEPWESHERDHQDERAGLTHVDRRLCQGIGCPYGDV